MVDPLPVILSLCVDAFPFVTDAESSARFWSAQEGVSSADAEWIADLYRKSGILNRRLAVADLLSDAPATSGHAALIQPIERRMQRACSVSRELVLRTALRALADSGLRLTDIGQVIIVSSTVLATPGLDVDLINELGLPRGVVRTAVNFSGCAAGIQALMHATSFYHAAQPTVRDASLIVCVEVSSVHAFAHTDKSQRVTHAIFGDGVAAAVVGPLPSSRESCAGKVAIGAAASALLPDLTDGIVLGMTAQAVTCSLSPRLPKGIVDNVAGWLEALLAHTNMDRADIGFWTIHTGGKKILESVQTGLGISQEQISSSWNVLEQYGNTISCGVFYVLDHMIRSGKIRSGEKGVMLSFAPGVSAEGLILAAL